jgi:hypothetical protein
MKICNKVILIILVALVGCTSYRTVREIETKKIEIIVPSKLDTFNNEYTTEIVFNENCDTAKIVQERCSGVFEDENKNVKFKIVTKYIIDSSRADSLQRLKRIYELLLNDKEDTVYIKDTIQITNYTEEPNFIDKHWWKIAIVLLIIWLVVETVKRK